MSATKLQIPLHRFGIAYYDEPTYDDPGWQVCDGDAVAALEQAYAEACKERNEARAEVEQLKAGVAASVSVIARQRQEIRQLKGIGPGFEVKP